MEIIGRVTFDNTKISSVTFPGKEEAKTNSMFYDDKNGDIRDKNISK